MSGAVSVGDRGKLADMRYEGDMITMTDAIELLRCDHDEIQRLRS